MNKRHIGGLAALGTATALVLGGCSAGEEEAATVDNGDQSELTVAVFNGWDEGIAASELWKAVLEEKGYDVEFEYADPAAVYAGLSTDDYDVTLDGWLPITHADYIEEYGDNLVDLGAWNEDAVLTIAVNEDAPIDSLEEFAANADLFNNQLVGIESGSGLNRVTTDEVIPTYGLENVEYITSSTPAMLAELTAATDAGENIAVTLWRPHWAYDAFPIKDLEDPQGTLGDSEGIHSFGGESFEANFPTLTGWLQDFQMDSERLYSLENVMFNESDTDDYGPIVEQWISENQEWVDSLTS